MSSLDPYLFFNTSLCCELPDTEKPGPLFGKSASKPPPNGTPSPAERSRVAFRQHFLYFLLLPQGHGSLRPTVDCFFSAIRQQSESDTSVNLTHLRQPRQPHRNATFTSVSTNWTSYPLSFHPRMATIVKAFTQNRRFPATSLNPYHQDI